MENDNIRCYACKHLLRYYTKGKDKFVKTRFGWCREKNDVVSVHGICDKFERRPNKKILNGFIRNSLNGLLNEITSIRQLIEEIENEKM